MLQDSPRPRLTDQLCARPPVPGTIFGEMSTDNYTRPANWFELGHLSGDPLLDNPTSVIRPPVADTWHNEDKTQSDCYFVEIVTNVHKAKFYFTTQQAALKWTTSYRKRVLSLLVGS